MNYETFYIEKYTETYIAYCMSQLKCATSLFYAVYLRLSMHKYLHSTDNCVSSHPSNGGSAKP